jgi:hypothetical protein
MANPIPELTQNDIKRFWEKVNIKTDNECWNWTSGKINGYGSIRIQNRNYPAHRVSLFLASNIQGLVARHSCDNPACCNPRHLVWGTQQDNVDDMFFRGRDRRGEYYTNPGNGSKNGRAKLTEADVLEIREQYKDGAKQTHLASKYGVGQDAISAIVNRKTWRHI